MFTRGYQTMTWDIWNCTWLILPLLSYCGWASEILKTTNFAWLKPQQKTMGCANHLWTGDSDFAGPSTFFVILRFPNLEMCWFKYGRGLWQPPAFWSHPKEFFHRRKPRDFLATGPPKASQCFIESFGEPKFRSKHRSQRQIGTPFLVLVPSTWCQGTRQLLSKDA